MKIIRNIICWIFCKYCLIAMRCGKVERLNKEIITSALASNKPIIFMIWHGRLAFAPFFIQDKKYFHQLHAIISLHGDGEMIAKVIDLFGFKSIRGSTNRSGNHQKGAKNRGATMAVRAALKTINRGDHVVITPDGPRGPNMVINETSIIRIAQKTGAVIIPLSAYASKNITFNSWDKFMLPLPFATKTLVVGEPIYVQKNDDIEKTRKMLENSLCG